MLVRAILLFAACAGAGLLLNPAPVLAHHASAAEFDGNKPVKLQGTIARVEWINPHAWIHIDVEGPDGKVVQWKIEGGSPNALFRLGVTKQSLQPGTIIIVEGARARDGTPKANGRLVTFLDGRKLFLDSPGGDARDQQR